MMCAIRRWPWLWKRCWITLAEEQSSTLVHHPGQRLFFALWPDPELSTEISRLAREVQGHNGRQHHPDDLHMTLVFLGAVGAEQLPCIERVADDVVARPFCLRLDRIDFWPRPRILLLGGSETPENLADLVGSLQAGLAGCGFKPERRPYRPHITLARKARKVAAADLERPLEWRPREFVLAGSNLQGKPPRYQILKSWKIG